MTGRKLFRRLIKLATWLVTIILLYFTARRWLFVIYALKAGPINQASSVGLNPDSDLPSVLILVPLRNEAQQLPELLLALDQLIYPCERLTVVFVNDGSTDDSAAVVQSVLGTKENWHLYSLAENVGKAQALNTALAQFSQGEIVVIYDADERPLPNALQQLVHPFADDRVGGVNGRRAVSNSLASPAASYTTFEGLVHQLVTIRAKDRLKLAPAIIGANCAYRRAALVEAGGFRPGALLEDSDLTLKLTQLGWRTHFEPRAVSYHRVPETIAGYWKQHTRWARGFNDIAKDQAGSLLFDRQLPFLLRLELVTFSLGYIDRVALIVGGLLALIGNWSVVWAIIISLLTPLVQIVAALRIAGESGPMWRRVIWVPLFFGLDIAMAATGFLNTLANVPQIWEERQTRK